MAKRVIILGAAGRDFHNFNTVFRDNKNYKVMAFTMTQIPISKRIYPRSLAGKLYPKGIPVYPEKQLTKLIKKHKIDVCVFSYSDIDYSHIMRIASEVSAAGADFWLLSPRSTELKSKKPVISVCAVRTGAGKSQTAREIVKLLRDAGKRVVVIRHPMPYNDLSKQIVERFATLDDLDKSTLEEREEFEPHITAGSIVYSGIDYVKILKQAEKEADVIIWDGGNNDFSFIKSDFQIVVADALRPGHEISYYPGEINVRTADVVIINKVNSATKTDIKIIEKNIKEINPKAKIIRASSPISVSNPKLIRNKRVLVIEDQPTLTHGGMSYGAGFLAAKKYKAKKIVNPKKYLTKSFKDEFKKYPHLKDRKILTTLGYSKKYISELELIINKIPADVVVLGTPTDLTHYLTLNKPAVTVKYSLKELTKPGLKQLIKRFL